MSSLRAISKETREEVFDEIDCVVCLCKLNGSETASADSHFLNSGSAICHIYHRFYVYMCSLYVVAMHAPTSTI